MAALSHNPRRDDHDNDTTYCMKSYAHEHTQRHGERQDERMMMSTVTYKIDIS